VDQTTEVLDPLSITTEEAEAIAKTEEEAVVIEDIGVIRDVDLANTIYTIPEVSEAPTMEFESVGRGNLILRFNHSGFSGGGVSCLVLGFFFSGFMSSSFDACRHETIKKIKTFRFLRK
jgi:hypothetical protein